MTEALERYRASAWWCQAALLGALCAVGWIALLPPLAQVGRGAILVLAGLAFGLVLGLLLALVADDVRRREDAVMAATRPEQRHQVRVAAGRGCAPTDPSLRPAALAVADLRLKNVRGLRLPGVALGVVLLTIAVWLSLSGRPVAVVFVAMAALFLTLCLLRPLQLRRRRDRLLAETSTED